LKSSSRLGSSISFFFICGQEQKRRVSETKPFQLQSEKLHQAAKQEFEKRRADEIKQEVC
jgi:hypothetical protein